MARLLRSEWVETGYTRELIDLVGGDERLAVVIYGTLLYDSIAWLSRPIPALDGATPLACLRTEAGKRRVKECLMRFPR